MILLYGRADDPPLERVAEAAEEMDVEVVVVDQRHLTGSDIVLEVDATGLGGRMVLAGVDVDLASVDAVYARPLELPRTTDPIEALRAQTFNGALLEWLEGGCCRVVNPPSAMDSNSSKPYQAQLIARSGFEVPDTLVSSDPDEVLAFSRRHGRVIYKSTSGVRSIVRELDGAARARLPLLGSLPTMFQAYVPGVDVRVHVVGRQVFPTEVRSEATDYRYAGADGHDAVLQACSLPEDIERRCQDLALRLRLPFCGIDLRRRPDGGWVCFEVNPMPAYSYYEAGTGQRISSAVVSLLMSASEERCDAGR